MEENTLALIKNLDDRGRFARILEFASVYVLRESAIACTRALRDSSGNTDQDLQELLAVAENAMQSNERAVASEKAEKLGQQAEQLAVKLDHENCDRKMIVRAQQRASLASAIWGCLHENSAYGVFSAIHEALFAGIPEELLLNIIQDISDSH